MYKLIRFGVRIMVRGSIYSVLGLEEVGVISAVVRRGSMCMDI